MSRRLFAAGMIGLGVLALIYGDFAMVWQPVAPWVPGRTALAYASGILMLLAGAGLLFRTTSRWSERILFGYLFVWMLLKVPALFVAPTMEAVWLGFGELAVLFTGGWVLFATSEKSLRAARLLFGLALIPIGLSHLIYVKQTTEFVPAWLPFRTFWAYATGVGQMACGVGVLFSIIPYLAAMVEAGLLSLFTFLVWLPAIVAEPGKRLPWTAFFISWAIAAAAFLMADEIRRTTSLFRKSNGSPMLSHQNDSLISE